MKDTIEIGDKVMCRHGIATIRYIELCEYPGQKYGDPVDLVSIDLKNYCVFDLSNGHWQYGSQISPVTIDMELCDV